MSKEATKQNSDKRTESEKPTVLTVDELDTVSGGPIILEPDKGTDLGSMGGERSTSGWITPEFRGLGLHSP